MDTKYIIVDTETNRVLAKNPYSPGEYLLCLTGKTDNNKILISGHADCEYYTVDSVKKAERAIEILKNGINGERYKNLVSRKLYGRLCYTLVQDEREYKSKGE